jgi:hypothetical protein
MSSHIKKALPLALALGALAPAAAQAKLDLAPPPQVGPPSRPPARVVTSPAPAGFDWGDAGIGAAGGLGLSMVAVGGSLALVGRRRHATAG